jgi:hypothetical protein
MPDRPAAQDASKTSKRFLDPMERISEILFGLVMVLTVTCSFSVGGGGRTDVREMLIGTLGCNLAWGAIGLLSCSWTKDRGTASSSRK